MYIITDSSGQLLGVVSIVVFTSPGEKLDESGDETASAVEQEEDEEQIAHTGNNVQITGIPVGLLLEPVETLQTPLPLHQVDDGRQLVSRLRLAVGQWVAEAVTRLEDCSLVVPRETRRLKICFHVKYL